MDIIGDFCCGGNGLVKLVKLECRGRDKVGRFFGV